MIAAALAVALSGWQARSEEAEGEDDPEDEAAFGGADSDSDGALTYEEVVKAGLADGTEAERKAWAKHADGDGRMGRGKFHRLCRQYRRQRACGSDGDNKLAAGWKKAYVDPDGKYREGRFDRADTDPSDGGLTRGEARQEATPLEERLFGRKRFNRADRNDDGIMTKGEAKRELNQEKKAYRNHEDDRPNGLKNKIRNRK